MSNSSAMRKVKQALSSRVSRVFVDNLGKSSAPYQWLILLLSTRPQKFFRGNSKSKANTHHAVSQVAHEYPIFVLKSARQRELTYLYSCLRTKRPVRRQAKQRRTPPSHCGNSTCKDARNFKFSVSQLLKQSLTIVLPSVSNDPVSNLICPAIRGRVNATVS
ncbi:hypothetical protein RUESEDTHA_01457 [Ruegeria sp. THAF57]|nr:hypothetical protein RUESEDTHA_01457 [Ruegeria sp. THAF57]